MTFRFALIIYLLASTTYSFAEDPEFDSVAEVLEHLQNRQDVKIRTQQEWTIAKDPEEMALYTFTTQGHPAHPAVFIRKVIQDANTIRLRTWSICEAEKAACDLLLAEMECVIGV